MSHREHLGFRDELYSRWHRRESMARFLGWERASALSMIDLDAVFCEGGLSVEPRWCEWENDSRMPVGLVEAARFVGKLFKPITVTTNLAMMANIPALVVLYEPDATELDIAGFFVKRCWPQPESKFSPMSPQKYAERLWRMREWSLLRRNRSA